MFASPFNSAAQQKDRTSSISSITNVLNPIEESAHPQSTRQKSPSIAGSPSKVQLDRPREVNQTPEGLGVEDLEKRFCSVCQVSISPRSWQSHEQTIKHQKALGIEEPEKRFCSACQVSVIASSWSLHERTIKHQQAMGVEDPEKRFCPLCQVSVMVSTWYHHERTIKHQKALGVAEPARLARNAETHFCEACNVTVQKSSWEDHLMTLKHQKATGPADDVSTASGDLECGLISCPENVRVLHEEVTQQLCWFQRPLEGASQNGTFGTSILPRRILQNREESKIKPTLWTGFLNFDSDGFLFHHVQVLMYRASLNLSFSNQYVLIASKGRQAFGTT
ncbi:hypothetical protein BU23DRAFT_565739 [Bimuria novae-zelandiae CBS 107.79]|uniref:U1-type domain-containing protein n=1 Tax=Bimuria novae-zelandiae CBS 107.79 TaxID=1447943 RepID=A0A6A5VNT7_9PLEO|nr:hypothetical protein BU23DRAFT_565739 [Bimuria novae-zelandiae CBS 107.79]